MSEVLPSVAALVDKVEGRTALYFCAAAVVFGVFVYVLVKNAEVPNAG